MNNPNPNYNDGPTANPNSIARASAGGATDPLDDPNYDWMDWVMTLEFLPEALVLRRNEFVEWAGAAGFENIEMSGLDEHDCWEFRCTRGTNAECTSAAQVERCLGFVARGARRQFHPGQFIAIADGDSIAARFRLEPREPQV
jgi:hypothetical protein